MTITKRLYYLDNLRVALTGLLIAHHVGQAYGPTGGSWPIQEAARAAVLEPFFTVNRSFFMSLFFLISGFFTAASCDDKGPAAFLKSRLLRLGLPLLVFALLMIPVQVFLFGSETTSGIARAWPIDVGYMWFVEHLLLFSAAYALWRALRRRQAEPDEHGRKAPHYLSIVAFALGLAVVSAVVRIWYPIDKWVFLLGFFRVAFADLPRDLAFFVIGLVAYRRQWLSTFPTRTGRVWLSVGLVLAGLWYAYALGLNALFPIGETAMGVIYPIWEALLCCGMCIGLVVLFRDRLDVQGRLGRALGQSQYAAYIFHVPVILLFQYAVLGLDFPPFAKFALVTLLSVPLTFLLSNWVRRPLQL